MTDRNRTARHIAAEATAIRDTELERAHARLESLSPQQRAIVDDFADALVARLIETPQHALADADERTLEVALELFGPANVTQA